jgi:hypothetical protein
MISLHIVLEVITQQIKETSMKRSGFAGWRSNSAASSVEAA